jgi:hypothetical protein
VADPYCLPNSSCLRNRLDIADPEELREVEARTPPPDGASTRPD